jgi:tetratricopeptide (TPR) repeat protein
MMRLASIGALEGLQSAMLVQLVFPLLDDPVRSVRIEAARVLAPVPVGELEDEQLSIYLNAVDEYIESQTVNAERPEAHLNLANYYVARGEAARAENALNKAIELEDVFMPAYINLADFYRMQGEDARAYKVLSQAKLLAPDNADVRHAIGLALVRQKKTEQAVAELEAAARLAKDNARYIYVYAVALNSTGKQREAIEQLRDAHDRFPENIEILHALISFHRDAGNAFAVERYRKRLERIQDD